MNFFLFLIFCAGVILLILQQQGKLPFGKEKGKLPPVERNVFNLEIGDIVQHEGIDWFVEGKLIYNTGAYTWFEYMLQEDDRICWLSVEEDDLVEVAILKNVEVPEINSDPPPEKLTYLEVDYHLVDSGTATMMRLGNTLKRQAQTCQYYDYKNYDYKNYDSKNYDSKNSDNLRLSVEVWDGDIEVTVGQKINPRMLNLLPGDGQRVYS